MAGTNDVITSVQNLVTGVIGPATSYKGLVLNYKPLVIDPNNVLPLAWVFTSSQHEERRGLGGPSGGNKWVYHTVHTVVVDASSTPSTREAQFRDMLDALRKQFRTNQSLGGLVLKFGEDIDLEIDEPQAAGGVMHYHAVITCQAIEQINVASP